MAGSGSVAVRGLYWVGPLTVAVSVLAVWAVQQIMLAVLPPLATWSGQLLASSEPAFVTAVLVGIGVAVFPVVIAVADDHSADPVRVFRRIASGVLIVSCLPNLVAPLIAGVLDVGMLALMVLHVVAWAVTVPMLTRLGIAVNGASS